MPNENVFKNKLGVYFILLAFAAFISQMCLLPYIVYIPLKRSLAACAVCVSAVNDTWHLLTAFRVFVPSTRHFYFESSPIAAAAVVVVVVVSPCISSSYLYLYLYLWGTYECMCIRAMIAWVTPADLLTLPHVVVETEVVLCCAVRFPLPIAATHIAQLRVGQGA